MTQLAYGANEVRALEVVLGGKFPKNAVDRTRAALKRDMLERFKQRKAYNDTIAPLIERAQAPMLELVKADAAAARSIEKLRSILLARGKKKLIKRHRPMKVEPRMVTGSGFWLKAPPYDAVLNSSVGGASASADKVTGEYTMTMGGFGGSYSARAGFGFSFFATEDNPMQRVAALVDYDYNWLDSSWGYTAHNNAMTSIWVFGLVEGEWVLQQGGLSPSWSDGTSWLDGLHGSNGGTGTAVYGRESLQAFFAAKANSWYLVWIFSDGSCDSHTSNLLGFSVSQQTQIMSIPFVVFGNL